MRAVTGTFAARGDAERAVTIAHTAGVPSNRITLLSPGAPRAQIESVPVVSTEQPGMAKAMGGVLGAAAALSGGGVLIVALVPGVGTVTALGLLGASVLAAAGAGIGGAVGGKVENAMTEGPARRRDFCIRRCAPQGKKRSDRAS